MTDQLTSLPNRRNFDERVWIEWSRAIRDKTPLSIMMIDLDNFKRFNDTYGHQQGDLALQSVSKTLVQELKRSVDYIARWGGEEFVILLANTDSKSAASIAERIRGSVESSPVIMSDLELTRLTLSIGLNTLTPTPECSIDVFINGADEALYAAKEGGRNRVCVADGQGSLRDSIR